MKKRRADFDRDGLLQELIDLCNQGIAENESPDEDLFLRNFFPIRSHYRILEPDTQLIIANKGAGKTQAFSALRFPKGRAILTELARANGRLALDVTKTDWIVGYADGKDFPPGSLLQAFARGRKAMELQSIWLGLLAQQLRGAEIGLRLERLDEIASIRDHSHSWNLNRLYEVVQNGLEELIAALDQLDTALARENRYIFVTYDALDHVSPGDWAVMSIILQGLIQLWAAYSRRWKRIRPKLFLRRDMFERAALVGPDIAKIAAHRAEILWERAELYGMLFKRILNSTGDLPAFLGKNKPAARPDERMGWVPKEQTPADYAPAVAQLVGTYMGADPRKGLTYTWMLSHLEDAHKNIYPRSLLRLIEQAADAERAHKRAEKDTLIHHIAVRNALDKVSELHLLELAAEFPWLTAIKESFRQREILVPADRETVLAAIRETGWEEATPPSTEPEHVLNYMIELGILRERTDRRIEVRDLFLTGLHMKRKGGVAHR